MSNRSLRLVRAAQNSNNPSDIAAYYDTCESDYRLVWRLRHSLAMHYGHWDGTTRTLHQALARQNEVLATAAAIEPDDHVLDAGCGVGGSAIFLARTHGARVTGITLSARQADSARRHARRRGVARSTTFAAMDYRRTGFMDRSFDVVWALESMCYAADTAAFAREAFRLLRPGGRLVVADAFAVDRPDDPAGVERRRAWLDCWAVNRLETVERFLGQLARIGFSAIGWADVTTNIRPSSRRLYAWSLLSLPFGRVAERLGLRTPLQTRNILGCRLQYGVFRDGLVRYALVRAIKPS